jgi:hypothetical protein
MAAQLASSYACCVSLKGVAVASRIPDIRAVIGVGIRDAQAAGAIARIAGRITEEIEIAARSGLRESKTAHDEIAPGSRRSLPNRRRWRGQHCRP